MTARPNNLLVIMTDQQRPDTIGAYGNPAIRTPNLDRLAQTGALFERAYCAQPVCSPSRASLLTGVYPHHHGVIKNGYAIPDHLPTLAELLRPAGYTCGYVGKWHLGYEREPQRGFEDYWISTEDANDMEGVERGREPAKPGHSAYHHFLIERGFQPPDRAKGGPGKTFGPLTAAKLPEAVGKPQFQAAACRRFLDSHRERPFFLMCSFREPHPPNYGPCDGMYDPDDIVLPASWYRELEPTVPLRYRVRQAHAMGRDRRWQKWLDHFDHYGIDAGDERTWKAAKARYWGLVTLVDKYVGQLLDHLEALGLAENTIVVHTGDHGDMMGEHHLYNKAIPYEGAVRVPLLLRAPGLIPRRLTTPVSHTDLVPTLLDLLDQPVPSHFHGRSLVPLLAGGDHAPGATEVMVEWNGYNGHPPDFGRPGRLVESEEEERLLRAVEWRSIRRRRWKLNVHASGEHELYDLDGDPGEMHNAIHDAGTTEVVRDLADRLRAWQERTGDPLRLP